MPSLVDALRSLRNPDGGWAYYPGKHSRIEPTCWALLALARAGSGAPAAPDVDVLRRWARQGPWLVDVPGVPINFAFNALAALVMRQAPGGDALAQPLVPALVEARGLKLDQSDAIRQDNSLQAWPWIDQTFSWVEPTAWCLIFLKQARRSAASPAALDERIRVGERMLIDRACTAGGWNYGGSNVYGQELYAYIPTSAMGVLALQDQPAAPAVTSAVQFLTSQSSTEPSAMALALSRIALDTLDVAGGPTAAAIADRARVAQDEGQVLGMAAALYATTPGKDAFRV